MNATKHYRGLPCWSWRQPGAGAGAGGAAAAPFQPSLIAPYTTFAPRQLPTVPSGARSRFGGSPALSLALRHTVAALGASIVSSSRAGTLRSTMPS